MELSASRNLRSFCSIQKNQTFNKISQEKKKVKKKKVMREVGVEPQSKKWERYPLLGEVKVSQAK